ncbi:MAG: nickel pincer cofactor biosynthesis protein LarB [Pirellulales bacterium]|nr:nickel pincer cofactor biosynthesis protein LarB [Pirellulales bacterium]
MPPNELEQLARQLLAGQCSPDEFLRRLTRPEYLATAEDSRLEERLALDSADPRGAAFAAAAAAAPAAATVDVGRAARCGFPEVIYGEGKAPATIAAIAQQLLARGQPVLITRVGPEKAAALRELNLPIRYNEIARTARIDSDGESGAPGRQRRGRVAVITAGTSDLPVAEEARETLDWMGVAATLVQDVGVAGPHRLPARLAERAGADAIVVAAGMEGALPSVVGGYVDCPVFGVPTSVGYGANFGGASALLSMLNSCAANVAVVNIDAGFKAGYLAGLVATRAARRSEHETD